MEEDARRVRDHELESVHASNSPVSVPVSEDDIVQFLFSVQNGAASIRPTAARIIELLAARPDAGAVAVPVSEEVETRAQSLFAAWKNENGLVCDARPETGHEIQRTGKDTFCGVCGETLDAKQVLAISRAKNDGQRAALAGLAVPDKGVRGDQGSSGGLGQPGSGSRNEPAVGATAALAMSETQRAAQRLRGLLSQHDTAVERYSKPEANARLVVLRSDLAAVLDHIDEDWFGEWVATSSARIKDRDAVITDEMVADAMHDAWNEISDDTGCHPLDIDQLGRKRLQFKPRHWAELTAIRLRILVAIVGATASTTPETGTEKVAAEVVQPIRDELEIASALTQGEGQ